MHERTMTDEQHITIRAAVAVLKSAAPNISDAGLFEVATGLVKRGAVAVDRNGVAYLHDPEKAGRHFQWAQRILDTRGATSADYAPPPLDSYEDPAERAAEQMRRTGVDPWCLANPGGAMSVADAVRALGVTGTDEEIARALDAGVL